MLWSRRERVAVAVGPERVRLLVANGNGVARSLWTGKVELPPDCIRAGLRSPGLVQPERVAEAVGQLVDQARGRGYLKRRPAWAAILLPDAAVKLATAPVEGEAPSKAAGERMARWILEDLLPIERAAARVDWTVLERTGAEAEGGRWLLGIGAEEALVREFEDLVERLDWRVGRIVPWTLGLAVGGVHAGNEVARAAGTPDDGAAIAGGAAALSTRRLLLTDGDGSVASLVEEGDIPRFHRAWRGPFETEVVRKELHSLQRYILDRLEMTVDEAWICGGEEWRAVVAAACRELGMRARQFEADAALLGALSG